MDQAIPAGTGQQLPLDLVVGILQAQHLRLVRLDGGEQTQVNQAVDPNISTPIAAGQMLQLRTDLDAAHPIPAVVGGVACLVEQRRALILDELQLLVAVNDLQQLLGVDVPAVNIIVGATIQSPHPDRVVRGAGDKALLRQRLRWLPLHIIWHCLHAPDARGVVEERVRLAHAADVAQIPDVQRVIVVDAAHLKENKVIFRNFIKN